MRSHERDGGSSRSLRGMLARYRIVRGRRPPNEPLPDGIREDTRKHTRHVLRPMPENVRRYLATPNEEEFRKYAARYEAEIAARFERDRTPFDELAERARANDVYLGCNCPTRKNPDVRHCHTVLALAFMKKKYPKLRVVMPRSRASLRRGPRPS